MSQKGFLNTAFIVLVVAIVVVVGYFVLRKTPPTSVRPSTSTQQTHTTNLTLPTSSPATIKNVSPQSKSSTKTATDWKIYRSDEYRFEFKYPPTWFVKHWKGDRIFFVCNEKLGTSCGPLPEGVIASFTITVMDNKDGLSVEKYAGSPAHGARVVEITTLGGEKALITVPRDLQGGQYPGEYLWVAKNEFVFMMIAGFKTKNDFYGKFGDVLSTFKFIEPPTVDGGDCC